MTKNMDDRSSTTDPETKPTPSGFQLEIPQDRDAPEAQKTPVAAGVSEEPGNGTHGRPKDDEDDGHS